MRSQSLPGETSRHLAVQKAPDAVHQWERRLRGGRSPNISPTADPIHSHSRPTHAFGGISNDVASPGYATASPSANVLHHLLEQRAMMAPAAAVQPSSQVSPPVRSHYEREVAMMLYHQQVLSSYQKAIVDKNRALQKAYEDESEQRRRKSLPASFSSSSRVPLPPPLPPPPNNSIYSSTHPIANGAISSPSSASSTTPTPLSSSSMSASSSASSSTEFDPTIRRRSLLRPPPSIEEAANTSDAPLEAQVPESQTIYRNQPVQRRGGFTMTDDVRRGSLSSNGTASISNSSGSFAISLPGSVASSSESAADVFPSARSTLSRGNSLNSTATATPRKDPTSEQQQITIPTMTSPQNAQRNVGSNSGPSAEITSRRRTSKVHFAAQITEFQLPPVDSHCSSADGAVAAARSSTSSNSGFGSALSSFFSSLFRRSSGHQ